jgi:hypothetical protein
MGLFSFQGNVWFEVGLGFSPVGEAGEGFVGSNEKWSWDALSRVHETVLIRINV